LQPKQNILSNLSVELLRLTATAGGSGSSTNGVSNIVIYQYLHSSSSCLGIAETTFACPNCIFNQPQTALAASLAASTDRALKMH
jgi:hypothetical protein